MEGVGLHTSMKKERRSFTSSGLPLWLAVSMASTNRPSLVAMLTAFFHLRFFLYTFAAIRRNAIS